MTLSQLPTTAPHTTATSGIKRPNPPPTSNTDDQPPATKKHQVAIMSSSSLQEANSSPAAVPLMVKRLSEDATVPTRGSAMAAGYDLYSAKATTIPARGKALVDTQLSIAVPEGTYGRVAPRSGLASKHMIDTGAGVIDADYRGTVFVLLFNHAAEDFQVNKGDRVAQLILERIVTPEVVEVDDLSTTVRGAGGFGSTGGFGAAPVAVAATKPEEAVNFVEPSA